MSKRQLETLTSKLSIIASGSSRIETAINNLQSEKVNIDASASRIADTDIAEDSARYAQLQILQQVGAAILAQANQIPSLALGLLNN